MKDYLKQAAFIVIILFLWQLLAEVSGIPPYLLPSPRAVFLDLLNNPWLLLGHGIITLSESVLGLILGGTIALILAFFIVRIRIFEILIRPLIVLSQTTPRVAIAPLLILWFGYSILPKILTAALISFFPVLMNTVKGLRSAYPELIDVMKASGATEMDIFLKLRIPFAVPYIFTGLKTAAPLSVIGAVVGEFVGADSGLGYLILISNYNFDTSMVFAALILLSVIGMFIYNSLIILERCFFKKYCRHLEDL